MQTYLTTIHGNSWDCPILSSLSQLLPDTLSDLISDTRSALLRDSLWWEADKEEGSNSDQAEHCSFNLCWLVPSQSALGTSVLFMHCNQSSWLTDGTAVAYIAVLITAKILCIACAVHKVADPRSLITHRMILSCNAAGCLPKSLDHWPIDSICFHVYETQCRMTNFAWTSLSIGFQFPVLNYLYDLQLSFFVWV